MKRMKLVPVLLFSLIQANAHARGMSMMGAREDNAMIANGQGIAAPSFFGALSGQNPAGLTENQRLKLQAGLAATDDSTANLRGSGGLLVGSGALGAGIEYSQYNSGAYASGSGVINWGAAGAIQSLGTTIGISGHHVKGGGSGSYDLGVFFDFIPHLRLAGMLKNVSNGISVIGAGLNFSLDSMVDLVLDADTDTRNASGVVKPGLTLHTDRVHFSAAYGYRYRGSVDSLLYSKFSAGMGIRLTDNFMVEYSYRGLPQHLLGLTMRLN